MTDDLIPPGERFHRQPYRSRETDLAAQGKNDPRGDIKPRFNVTQAEIDVVRKADEAAEMLEERANEGDPEAIAELAPEKAEEAAISMEEDDPRKLVEETRRRWSRNHDRGAHDYTDAGCRVLAEHGFKDVNELADALEAALEREKKDAELLAPFRAALAEDVGALIVALYDLPEETLDKVLTAAQSVDSVGLDAYDALAARPSEEQR